MTVPVRSNSVPKMMLPVYQKIVGLTDDVCDKHLNSEYRDLARAMTAVLCRKRPSPLASGQPRTWACGIVYVLGRINFLADKSFSPHMTTADLCAAFDVGESTVHAKALLSPAVRSAVLGREESASMDGRGEWPAGRFARHAPGNPGNCLRRRIDPLHSRGPGKPILNATIAPVHAARAALHQNLVANFRCGSFSPDRSASNALGMSASLRSRPAE